MFPHGENSRTYGPLSTRHAEREQFSPPFRLRPSPAISFTTVYADSSAPEPSALMPAREE